MSSKTITTRTVVACLYTSVKESTAFAGVCTQLYSQCTSSSTVLVVIVLEDMALVNHQLAKCLVRGTRKRCVEASIDRISII